MTWLRRRTKKNSPSGDRKSKINFGEFMACITYIHLGGLAKAAQMQFDSEKDSLRLKRLLESVISEELRLDERGLLFEIKRIKTGGNPLTRIVASAELHFLRAGSPFCCSEPNCHVPFDSKQIEQIGDRIRRCLKLQQPVTVDIVQVQAVLHKDVILDCTGTNTFVPERIDERDELGRTALWRAATRGYLSQVEELLHSGANPIIPGPVGKTLSDLIGENLLDTSIVAALEKAAKDHCP